jgi:hypothetical protein
MVVVTKKPKEKLSEIIPLYFEYVAEYIRTGRHLPKELNPIHTITKDIDSMTVKEQQELISKIEYNIEMLKSLLGELSFFI